MARPPLSSWSETVLLADLARGPIKRRLEPDEAQRKALARQLGLVSLNSLTADVTLSPWLDGGELTGRLRAEVVQTCGVTLENFAQPLSAEFMVRLVPPGSPNAQANDDEGEIDLDAPDPPDVLEGETVDLAAYVIEHLALEVDPFPRKPGAVFEPPPAEEEASPFAVLRRLKQDDSPD